jgi:hypothetical protein
MLFLGWRSQAGFAEALGCSQNHLSALLKMSDPPVMMRGGLDAALCRELRTDRFSFFTDFRNIAPEATPVQGHPRRPARESVAA